MESDTFYGNFMVKLVRRLSGVCMEKTWQIKSSPNNLHINFTNINLHKSIRTGQDERPRALKSHVTLP